MQHDIEQLKFPIGRFNAPEIISAEQINLWINEIAELPRLLKEATRNLTTQQLNTVYRPGGWTLCQVIHHLADSHMNAYIRFKLAITEDNAIIRPYFEERWAELEDAKAADISSSLNIIEALHIRWVLFMRKLKPEEWSRTYFHPESKKTIELKEVAGTYAWHGKHHLNHILITIK